MQKSATALDRLAEAGMQVGGLSKTESDDAGKPWKKQPVISVRDAFGNTITSDNTTIVTLDCALPITCPGKLVGNFSQLRVTNGVADFSGAGLHLGTTTNGIQLKATSTPSMPIAPTFSDQFNEN